MDDVFGSMEIFIAAIHSVGGHRFDKNPFRFASVVRRLAKDGNEFAGRWTVYPGYGGRFNCHAFSEGFALMRLAGMISIVYPSGDGLIEASPRILREIEGKAGKETFTEAVLVAKCYLGMEEIPRKEEIE
jgi:hypothetical protein